MSELQVRGSGGGKSGGGGGGITEGPDTLSSTAFVQFVDAISEGEIKGLVKDEYSIYLDGVPMRDLAGTENYKPFSWKANVGTPNQPPLENFTGTEQEVAVQLPLKKSVGALIRDISDSDADAIRVTVSVDGLTRTTKEGEISGYSVAYMISIRQLNGTWLDLPVQTISGKTSARYQKSVRVDLGAVGVGPYQVKVARVSDDSTSSLIVNGLNWDSFTIINYEKLNYPNTALVGVRLDARHFNQVPTRSYHVQGLIIRVPKNYDPVTRIYATTGPGTTNGAWNGEFKLAYSNNPAWCFYDLVTNRRYGLGRRISESQVDKWVVYSIGVYCDQQVPKFVHSGRASGYSKDGTPLAGVKTTDYQGETEPRFTLNCVINSREQAYKLLGQLSTAFRGMAYWGNSSVLLTQDRPTDPSMLFNNSNVEGGVFNYEGSPRSQRNTVIMVGWNDPAEDFKQKWEYVEDRIGLQRYGVRSTDVVAFGCTSRSQARRIGLWTLYTQRLDTETITFKAGNDTSVVMPGDVVQIMDSQRLGARWGGRIVSQAAGAVTIDQAVTLTAGSYTLSVLGSDGLIHSRPLTLTAGSHTTFTTSPVLPTLVAGAIWTLASSTVIPKLGRVISVKEEESGFLVTCAEHSPAKFAAVDNEAVIDDKEFSFLSYDSVSAITGLTAVENTTQESADHPIQTRIVVSWDKPSNPLISGFIIRYVGLRGSSATLPQTSETGVSITGVVADTYTVYVKAVNHLGLAGQEAYAIVSVTSLPVTPPDTTPADALVNLQTTVSFSAVTLTWDKPTYVQGGGNGETRIYYYDRAAGAPLPTASQATYLESVPGNTVKYVDTLMPNVTRHYWAAHVTRGGAQQVGLSGGTNGAYAVTDKVLANQVDGRGFNILDSAGVPVFSADGKVSPSAYVNVNGNVINLTTVASNSLVPSINFVGSFTSPPTQVMLGTNWRQNSTYRNSSDGRTYILTGTPLGWEVYLESGSAYSLSIESTNGTVFRVGQGTSTLLKARLFKNGAEVTDVTPAAWFRWRRSSAIPQQAPNDDATWNSQYLTGFKNISLSVDSVYARATFFCDVISN